MKEVFWRVFRHGGTGEQDYMSHAKLADKIAHHPARRIVCYLQDLGRVVTGTEAAGAKPFWNGNGLAVDDDSGSSTRWLNIAIAFGIKFEQGNSWHELAGINCGTGRLRWLDSRSASE
jgi:hypothetical protein